MKSLLKCQCGVVCKNSTQSITFYRYNGTSNSLEHTLPRNGGLGTRPGRDSEILFIKVHKMYEGTAVLRGYAYLKCNVKFIF